MPKCGATDDCTFKDMCCRKAQLKGSSMALDKAQCIHRWEMAVVRKVVNRHRWRIRSLRREEVDDLCQECMTHWFEVRERFRPHAGRPPRAYLAQVVRNRLTDLIRQYETAKRVGELDALSLDAPLGDEEGAPTLHDLIADRVHCSGDARRTRSIQDMRIDMMQAMTRLEPRQIYLCGLLSEGGLSVSEAAVRLGMPRSTLYEELKRIRTVFADAGLDDYLTV